jgi:GNAT superfamily N-acetyltransferase
VSVEHADLARCGLDGRATVSAALQAAWDQGCGQVMLITGRGRRDATVLTFYESCGFERRIKDGFVARRSDAMTSG